MKYSVYVAGNLLVSLDGSEYRGFLNSHAVLVDDEELIHDVGDFELLVFEDQLVGKEVCQVLHGS